MTCDKLSKQCMRWGPSDFRVRSFGKVESGAFLSLLRSKLALCLVGLPGMGTEVSDVRSSSSESGRGRPATQPSPAQLVVLPPPPRSWSAQHSGNEEQRGSPARSARSVRRNTREPRRSDSRSRSRSRRRGRACSRRNAREKSRRREQVVRRSRSRSRSRSTRGRERDHSNRSRGSRQEAPGRHSSVIAVDGPVELCTICNEILKPGEPRYRGWCKQHMDCGKAVHAEQQWMNKQAPEV